jgi:hypothetical protein
MNHPDRPSTPSISCRPAAVATEEAVEAVEPAAPSRLRRALVEAVLLGARHLARSGSPPAMLIAHAALLGFCVCGACVSWLAGVLPTLRRIVTWASIGLVLAVVGGYAFVCPRAAVSPHRFDIGPEPDTRPLPAAPVGPLPPEAALVASNGR